MIIKILGELRTDPLAGLELGRRDEENTGHKEYSVFLREGLR